MSSIKLFLLATCLFLPTAVFSQTKPEPAKPEPGEAQDVIKFDTSLVQTDVMVFDKNGRFVDGLKPEQFQLKIDKAQREISFFERITSGGLSGHREGMKSDANQVDPAKADAQRRTVIFFVDDLHLAPDSLERARKSLLEFINNRIGENDLVAITSPSGQIGFLQQLTSDKEALRSAVARLSYRTNTKTDMDKPPMSEYIALKIREGDEQALVYYTQEVQRQNCFRARNELICTVSPQAARQMVKTRAQQIAVESAPATDNTLRLLEGLMRTAAQLPGRKVVFVISDGFYLNDVKTGSLDRIKRVTDAAGKAGVVIYTLDARGIIGDSIDITNSKPIDGKGMLTGASIGEISASQDGLNALAKDTGGQAFRNTNRPMHEWVEQIIDETSNYYLIAWKPDTESQKQNRFRNVEVKLIGHPGYTVRVRKGYFDLDPPGPVTAKAASAQNKPAAAQLRESIAAAYPTRDLPILLSADYYDLPNKGPTISTAIQIPGEFLVFYERPDGKIQAAIDLSAAYFDEKGIAKASFMERIVTTAPSLEQAKTYRNDITFTYPAQLTPGIYQVRVAARDDKSGKIGAAHAWVEIPDLTDKKLAMSSLLLGERTQAMMTNVANSDGANPVALSASHRFRRESTLRFLIFTYNMRPSPADQKPDIVVQTQVVRDDQPVLTTALRKISTDGVLDMTRLPYAAEIPLAELLPGRYVLHVTVIDRTSKQSVSRQTHFDVY